MTPKSWREQEGWTLEKLSQETGFSIGYLSEVENGIKDGSIRLYRAYHRVSKGEITFPSNQPD